MITQDILDKIIIPMLFPPRLTSFVQAPAAYGIIANEVMSSDQK